MSDLIINTKELKNLSIELGKLGGNLSEAQVSAINRTVDYTATQIAKGITDEYIIKKSDISKTMKKNKASKANPHASITYKGHTISLMHFKVLPKTPPKTKSGRKKVVSVGIKKSGMKPITTSSPAFVQTMNYATNVWMRDGKKHTPTKGRGLIAKNRSKKGVPYEREGLFLLRTLSVPQMAESAKVYPKVSELAEKKLQERIQHEIEYRLEKASKAIKR